MISFHDKYNPDFAVSYYHFIYFLLYFIFLLKYRAHKFHIFKFIPKTLMHYTITKTLASSLSFSLYQLTYPNRQPLFLSLPIGYLAYSSCQPLFLCRWFKPWTDARRQARNKLTKDPQLNRSRPFPTSPSSFSVLKIELLPCPMMKMELKAKTMGKTKRRTMLFFFILWFN